MVSDVEVTKFELFVRSEVCVGMLGISALVMKPPSLLRSLIDDGIVANAVVKPLIFDWSMAAFALMLALVRFVIVMVSASIEVKFEPTFVQSLSDAPLFESQMYSPFLADVSLVTEQSIPLYRKGNEVRSASNPVVERASRDPVNATSISDAKGVCPGVLPIFLRENYFIRLRATLRTRFD